MHRLSANQRAKEQTVISPRLSTLRLRPWLIGCLTLAADQLTKWIVTITFVQGQSLPILPPVLHLTYVQNIGAAFGLWKGQQLLFIACSLIVSGWIVWEFLTTPTMAPVVIWGYALILGGAVGNLIDRIRFGYVIDFIDLRVWPVFNVGDSAITIGVTLLLWYAFITSRVRRH